MGKATSSRWLKMLIALTDLIILYSSFTLAFHLRFHYQIPAINLEPFIKIAPWLGMVAIIIFYFFNLYSGPGRKDYHQFIYSILLSVGLFTIIMVAMSFWGRGFAFPRSVIILGAIIQSFLMISIRTGIWLILLKLSGKKRVLIVGKEMEDGLHAAGKFLEHAKGWFEIHSLISIDRKQELERHMQDVDVILLTPELTKDEKAAVLSNSYKYQKEVLVVPDLYELFLMGAEPQQIDDMLVFSIMPPNLGNAERFLKRVLDVLVSVILLIVMFPVMLLLYILVPLTSKGGAIYRQERLGKDGKPYMLYKFRSMIENAEKFTGAVLATKEDPRITTLGKFMRATRLDELPQLFNVLKGDMSLVGPRPERAVFIKQFQEELPHYTYRMMVKPGITGLAQVMAKYSTKVEDKLRYDLMYIRNYSLVLDLKILFYTLLVVLKGDQADGVSETDEERERLIKKMLHTTQREVALGRDK